MPHCGMPLLLQHQGAPALIACLLLLSVPIAKPAPHFVSFHCNADVDIVHTGGKVYQALDLAPIGHELNYYEALYGAAYSYCGESPARAYGHLLTVVSQREVAVAIDAFNRALPGSGKPYVWVAASSEADPSTYTFTAGLEAGLTLDSPFVKPYLVWEDGEPVLQKSGDPVRCVLLSKDGRLSTRLCTSRMATLTVVEFVPRFTPGLIGVQPWLLSQGVKFPTHEYQFVTVRKTWSQARIFAHSQKLRGYQRGYLATVTSKRENDFLEALVNAAAVIAMKLAQPPLDFNFGGNDLADEGRWVWDGGPELGVPFWDAGKPTAGIYTNFGSGQPDNFDTPVQPDGTGEDVLYFSQDTSTTGWTDGPAAPATGNIVEFGGFSSTTNQPNNCSSLPGLVARTYTLDVGGPSRSALYCACEDPQRPFLLPVVSLSDDPCVNERQLVTLSRMATGDDLLPSPVPSAPPTPLPTDAPTSKPTGRPTTLPTRRPTATPTPLPSRPPTAPPISRPTGMKTRPPTDSLTKPLPTALPTAPPDASAPTAAPVVGPPAMPSSAPTDQPTPAPTLAAAKSLGSGGGSGGGVVAGAVCAVLLVVVALAVLLVIRKRRRNQHQIADDAAVVGASGGALGMYKNPAFASASAQGLDCDSSVPNVPLSPNALYESGPAVPLTPNQLYESSTGITYQVPLSPNQLYEASSDS